MSACSRFEADYRVRVAMWIGNDGRARREIEQLTFRLRTLAKERAVRLVVEGRAR